MRWGAPTECRGLVGTPAEDAAQPGAGLAVPGPGVLLQGLGQAVDGDRLQDDPPVALDRCQGEALATEERGHDPLPIEPTDPLDAVPDVLVPRDDAAGVDAQFAAVVGWVVVVVVA